MKFFSKAFLLVLTILCVFFLGALFLPTKVRVQRSLPIQANAQNVFDQVNTIKNWEKWSPWHRLDPNLELKYSGPESGVGASYAWESDLKKVGSGSLTITESVPNERIRTTIDFRKQGQAIGSFDFRTNDLATTVTWSMETHVGRNPVSRYFGLFLGRMIRTDFDQGLRNLRDICEGGGSLTNK